MDNNVTEVKKIVTLQFTVTLENKDHKWTADTHQVDDSHFVRFSKWDRGLIAFVLGQSKRGSDVHINCAFWDTLFALKQQAMNAALRDAMGWGEEAFQKKKTRNANSSDLSILPKTLVIDIGGCSIEILPVGGLQEMWIKGTEVAVAAVRQRLQDACLGCEWSTFKKKGANKRKQQTGKRKAKKATAIKKRKEVPNVEADQKSDEKSDDSSSSDHDNNGGGQIDDEPNLI
jgi:hypothetical protein